MVKPPPPLTPRRPSFFKVMLGEFSSSLSIPPSFSKHLKGNLGVKSVLRGPGGRKWRVKVSRAADRWLLENGWEEFVKENSVVEGDFLVFHYDSDFVFDVQVYGKTGCEKYQSIPAADVAVPNKEAAARQPEKRQPKAKEGQGKPIYIGRTSRGLIKLNRSLRGFEMQRAFEDACAFKPPNPYFVAACKISRSGNNMTIPYALAKEYELAKKDSVILQDPKMRTWHVNIYHTKDGGIRLATGWADFLRRNSMKEGDACSFEFIQGGDLLYVHIFYGKRDKDEGPESVSKDDGSIEKIERPTKTDRDRVLDAAYSFKSDNSFFVHVWSANPYQVTIPRLLVRKFALRSKNKLVLCDPCGRQWNVKIGKRANGNTDLGIGLMEFRKGNNLRKGDTSVFEFVNAETLRVHIFHVKEVKFTRARKIHEKHQC